MTTVAAVAPQTSVEEMEQIMKEIDPIAPAESAAAAAPSTRPASSPLNLKAYVKPEQLRQDVEFNANNLDDAMMRHAGLFVHYSVQAAAARRQHDRMKVTMDILESRLYAHHRTVLMNPNVTSIPQEDGTIQTKVEKAPKITEAQVEAAVKADARWWSAQQRLIDARMMFDLANDARNAFEQRKDMMVQIAVDRRIEREGQLRINAAQNTDGRAAALAAEQQRNSQKKA